jgi:hypothetical protein
VSVVIVLLVPASEIVVRDVEDLLTLKIAANSNIAIITPTIHTHGAVYHSVWVVVVVVFTVVLPPVLSCDKQIFPIRNNAHRVVSNF